MYRLQISMEVLVGMLVALLAAFVLLLLFQNAHVFTLRTYASVQKIAEAAGVVAIAR